MPDTSPSSSSASDAYLTAMAPSRALHALIGLIAGVTTALMLSLIVGLTLGIHDIRLSTSPSFSPLSILLTNVMLGLAISLPFGLWLAPAVCFLLGRSHWPVRLAAASLVAAGVTELILPYHPQMDGVPFFALAAAGGLITMLLHARLLRSSVVRSLLTRPQTG